MIIKLEQSELYAISECIIAKMNELNTCYQIATKEATRRAIRIEIDELEELNERVCNAANG